MGRRLDGVAVKWPEAPTAQVHRVTGIGDCNAAGAHQLAATIADRLAELVFADLGVGLTGTENGRASGLEQGVLDHAEAVTDATVEKQADHHEAEYFGTTVGFFAAVHC